MSNEKTIIFNLPDRNSCGVIRCSFFNKGERNGYRFKSYSVFSEVWPYRRDSKINQRKGEINEIFDHSACLNVVWIT